MRGTGDGSLSQCLLVQKQPIRPIFDVIIIEKQASIKSLIHQNTPRASPRGVAKPSPRTGKGDRLRWMRSPQSGLWIQLCRVRWGEEPSPVPLSHLSHGCSVLDFQQRVDYFSVEAKFEDTAILITGKNAGVIENVQPIEK